MATRTLTAALGNTLSLAVGDTAITASTLSRSLAGELVRYGVYGRTSIGPIKVRRAAIRLPEDITRVKLTEEHFRGKSRGHLSSVSYTPTGIRVVCRVSDGPDGDTALREAADRTRDAFSFDVVDYTLDGDELVDGLLIAIGQVGIPAYADSRIDTIAASHPQGDTPMFTAEQAARLIELQAKDTLTDEEAAELKALQALAELYPPTTDAAPDVIPVDAAAVAASTDPDPAASTDPDPAPAATAAMVPAVPGSVPAPGTRSPVRTAARAGDQFWRRGDLRRFTQSLVTAAQAGGGQAILAALADVTHADNTAIIEPPGWSGELWSGLEYEPIWTDLFTQGELTNWEGKGWRFKSKLVMQDYAGNKTEIPTSKPETEPSDYEAARMAVGVDIDRKFFDFKNAANAAFLAALPEQARESWAIKLDDKVRAYALAEAVAAEGAAAQPTLLKAAAVAIRALRRRRVIGRNASTWVVVNDDDLMSLIEINQMQLPAFLDLWGVDPTNFRSDQTVPAGTVLAGARQAATVRTLPGSPIRVDAENLARGGVDEAFFGYWAIEEHHTAGIAKAVYIKP